MPASKAQEAGPRAEMGTASAASDLELFDRLPRGDGCNESWGPLKSPEEIDRFTVGARAPGRGGETSAGVLDPRCRLPLPLPQVEEGISDVYRALLYLKGGYPVQQRMALERWRGRGGTL